MTLARTSGSPPVRRTESSRDRRSYKGDPLDLLEGEDLGAGNQATPSSGMQYTQRKLQRSVTESRRSVWTRPNESMSGPEVASTGLPPRRDRDGTACIDSGPTALVRSPAPPCRPSCADL